MHLIRRSRRAANAVQAVSPGGELFVASIVTCMVLASFGGAVDPVWLGEAGLELAFLDLGGEFSSLAMRHWHILELLLAGGVVAVGIMVLRIVAADVFQQLDSADTGAVEKVPI